MSHPSPLHPAQRISVVAIFTSLILATNYALINVPNVKLMDVLVFTCSYLFGLATGLAVASLSWLVYGFVNPYGSAGYLLPALIAGEALYAIGGALARRRWPPSSMGRPGRWLQLGSLGLLLAFAYDLETNYFTALLIRSPFIPVLLLGVPFAVLHELSDFAFFGLAAPALIAAALRTPLGRWALLGEAYGPA
jgi:hypothetical protein